MATYRMKKGYGSHTQYDGTGKRVRLMPGDTITCSEFQLSAKDKFELVSEPDPPPKAKVGLTVSPDKGGKGHNVTNEVSGKRLNATPLSFGDARVMAGDARSEDKPTPEPVKKPEEKAETGTGDKTDVTAT